MLYYLYELNHAAVAPWRAAANFGRFFWKNPGNPLSGTYIARSMAASLDMFERATRRYGKPEFGITDTRINGSDYRVSEEVVWERPFCRMLHFRLEADGKPLPAGRERVLIVAPMSGHYATLLRGTVAAMLPHADIHITDWADARQVELSKGAFDLDDYIDYLLEMIHHLGPGSHIMAVCQPSVPVLAAVSLMNARNDPDAPASMVLMGGPIDTRRNPTAVNKLAVERGIEWFKRNVIVPVPMPHPGCMREVYPGFLQLTGFMTMNLDRHIDAHRELFWHLVQGDGDSADKHDEFYDEYLSVMDLTAEFYLQTVEKVFVEHALRTRRVQPSQCPGQSGRDHPHRPDDGRRRARRHIRRRPDRGGPRSVQRSAGGNAGAPSAAPGRPLRGVQRLALPRGDHATDHRLHGGQPGKRGQFSSIFSALMNASCGISTRPN